MAFKLKEEEIVQIQALECLRHYYPEIAACVIHIANERKTSPWYGSMLKRLGVRKGVPDLLFPKPCTIRGFHGLWIEVKTLKGKPSKEQIAFIDEANTDDYYACFAYGSQQIIDVVCDYFSVARVFVLE